jgi:hypothetical protein
MNPVPSPVSGPQETAPAKDAAVGLASDAKEQTARIAAEAKNQLGSVVDNQRQQAATSIGHFAGAFLQAAHSLDDSGQQTLARSALSVAQKADDLSRYVRDKDLGAVVDDVKSVARRNPALFIGVALAGGFLLARFLKSSERRMEPSAVDDFARAGQEV